ncbi:MAG TPA: hypothetical protein VM368_03840 [Flavisolibacter sp.]|nr:hypothetical protein [Flavisolibacter sp.]
MKKYLIAIAVSIISQFSYADEPVNDIVLKAFKETFPHIKKASWADAGNFYEAFFKETGGTTRVRYSKDGEVLTTIRTYKEEKLPLYIQMKIKKKYADKKIRCITELSNDDGVSYYIMLEDEKHLIEVVADASGYMSVNKKLKKA